MPSDDPADTRLAAEVAKALADRPEAPWYDIGRPIPSSPNRVPAGLSFKAARLLRLASFLGPDPIPLRLFSRYPDRLPMELRGTVEAAAKELGFRGDVVNINRGVALGVREACTPKESAEAIATVRRLLREHLPGDVQGREDWPTWRALLKHTLAAVSDPAVGPPDHISWLHDRAATYLQETGQLAAARLLFERALRLNEAAYGPEHAEVGLTLANLGIVMRMQADHDEAAAVLERAVRVTGTAFGRDSADVMYPVSQLGLVMSEVGRFTDAKFLQEWALRNAEKNFGPDHPTTAVRLTNLAGVLHDLGDGHAAHTMYQRALRIEETAYGPDSAEAGDTLNNLGLLLKDMGRRSESVNALERALAIAERTRGPRHADVAATLNNLGLLSVEQGFPSKAIPRLERALAIGEAVFGRTHPQVGLTLHNLAVARAETGHREEARRLMARAIAIFETAYGTEHRQTRASRTMLAGWR
ncbi:tetratricopeptide repeat protein [Phytomonospora endophytica]|uniref:Tetratricopeptide (TPR) repeat protein n=1 Tax=Phytomonospora endophytica TaxID=714109 RepID=A0A841FZV3_9ACTN|nr:tetratricopeptide repeat protein [Phytomonospora endophytica]MBB6038927.1 tetratricopeptide (TPR) repeat protein [Phytomonospora endophytica]GIG67971.1 hypothetical protein Pen01_42660 [Phytomonospora endophytica]